MYESGGVLGPTLKIGSDKQRLLNARNGTSDLERKNVEVAKTSVHNGTGELSYLPGLGQSVFSLQDFRFLP